MNRCIASHCIHRYSSVRVTRNEDRSKHTFRQTIRVPRTQA
ncbi:MAG: hypothetical protein WBB11_00050 [Ferruginibacter sp.]